MAYVWTLTKDGVDSSSTPARFCRYDSKRHESVLLDIQKLFQTELQKVDSSLAFL